VNPLIQLLLELEKRLESKRSVHERVINDPQCKFHKGQLRAYSTKDSQGNLARFVALLTHRRWGKTEGSLRYAGGLASIKPKSRLAYIAQQRTNAKDLAWPIIHELDDEHKWNLHYNNVDLTAEWANGSRLKLYGADDKRFQRLIRGQKFDFVVVDEAQDFIFSDIKSLTHRVLIPTVADLRGRIFMQGTPGEQCHGYFYEATVKRVHTEWAVVLGEKFENPHTSIQLQEQLELLKKTNPRVANEPWVRREFFGDWISDTRRNVIKISPELNYLYKWEREDSDKFILGIDFGFDDPSAYVLATENPDRYPYLIYLDAHVQRKMYLHDHVKKIKEFQEHYPGIRIVADPGGTAKTLTEELRQVYGLPIEDAAKQEKRTHVERLNSEATLGIIKIYNLRDPGSPESSPIARQWNELIRVFKSGAIVSDNSENDVFTDEWEEGTPRHVHDACVYARRGAMLTGYSPKEEISRSEYEQRYMMEKAFSRNRRKRRYGA
jgi:hypothetical protein